MNKLGRPIQILTIKSDADQSLTLIKECIAWVFRFGGQFLYVYLGCTKYFATKVNTYIQNEKIPKHMQKIHTVDIRNPNVWILDVYCSV